MSTNNECFCGKVRKIICEYEYPLLSGAMNPGGYKSPLLSGAMNPGGYEYPLLSGAMNPGSV